MSTPNIDSDFELVDGEASSDTTALMLPPDAAWAHVADVLVARARADGVALTGDGALLTSLIQRVLQGSLEAEITEHLGYEPHAIEGHHSGNSRNGHYPKTV